LNRKTFLPISGALLTLLALALPVAQTRASDNPSITLGPWLNDVVKDGVVIRWETDQPQKPVVVIKLKEGKEYPGTYEKVEVRYGFLSLKRSERWQNSVRITGLEPGTRYDYAIKNSNHSGHFITAPDEKKGFTFAVYGDSRAATPGKLENPDHEKVVAAVAVKYPAFLINTGDMVYSGDSDHDWRLFFENIKPIAPNIPLFPVFGNHEARGGDDAVKKWDTLFSLPGQGPKKMYYSFRYGNTLFVVLCSTCGLRDGDPQVAWTKAELEKASKDPGIENRVAAFHNPMYTCGNHKDDENAKRSLEPLFKRYGVKLVLAGHNHIYEHLLENGVHYLTLGGGGAPLHDIKTKCDHNRFTAASRLHFALISVNGGVIGLKIFDDAGVLMDSFVVK